MNLKVGYYWNIIVVVCLDPRKVPWKSSLGIEIDFSDQILNFLYLEMYLLVNTQYKLHNDNYLMKR